MYLNAAQLYMHISLLDDDEMLNYDDLTTCLHDRIQPFYNKLYQLCPYLPLPDILRDTHKWQPFGVYGPVKRSAVATIEWTSPNYRLQVEFRSDSPGYTYTYFQYENLSIDEEGEPSNGGFVKRGVATDEMVEPFMLRYLERLVTDQKD